MMINRKTHPAISAGGISRRDMLRIGGLVVPVSLLPGFLQTAFAATTYDYYISPSGSDSNPGTQSQPWAISALNTKRSLYRGKTVGLLAGTYYPMSVNNVGGYETPLLDVEGGTASSPTVIASVTPQAAVLDSRLTVSDRAALGNSTAVTQGNLVLDGLKFTKSVCRAVKLGDLLGPTVTGMVVKNCEFTGNNASVWTSTGGNYSSLELMSQSGGLFQNNYFHDNVGYKVNSGDHHSAILGWKCRDNVFEYNTVSKSGNVFGKADGHSGNIFRYNYIDVSNQTDTTPAFADWCGTTTGTGNTTKVYNNVIIGGSAADMRSAYYGADYTQHRVEVFNNTLIVLDRLASFGFLIRTSSGYLKFYNNIVTSVATSEQAFTGANVDASSVMDYNMYYRPSGSPSWCTYASKTSTARDYVGTLSLLSSLAKSLLTGGSIEGNSKLINPLFVGSGTNALAYKLQSGSPAKGMGHVGGTSSGAATDLGAWGNGATRIGHDFGATATAEIRPQPPVLDAE